jgi:hypothetical protein
VQVGGFLGKSSYLVAQRLAINSPRIYPAENFLRRMDRPTRIELVLKHLIRLAVNLKNAGNDDFQCFCGSSIGKRMEKWNRIHHPWGCWET